MGCHWRWHTISSAYLQMRLYAKDKDAPYVVSSWWQPKKSTDSKDGSPWEEDGDCVGGGKWGGEKQRSGRDPAAGFHPSVECRGTLKLGACRGGTGPVPWDFRLGSLPGCGATPRVPALLFPAALLPAFSLANPTSLLLCLVGLPTPSLSHHLLCQSFNHYPPFITFCPHLLITKHFKPKKYVRDFPYSCCIHELQVSPTWWFAKMCF